MKRHLAFILLLLAFPALVFAEAVPLSDLLTASDDYWRTSTPQRPRLIEGGKINGTQQYIPVPTSATLGLVGYASGAAALGGLAFYQHTGKDPVTALIDGVHHVFNPVWIAFQENFVSPETYPAAAAQFVGVEAAVGAKIADLVEHVQDSAAGSYSSLKSLIAPFIDPGYAVDPLVSTIPAGTIVQDTNGQKWRINAGPYQGGIMTLNGWNTTKAGYIPVPALNGAYKHPSQNNIYYLGPWQEGQYYKLMYYQISLSALDPTLNPSENIDIAGIHEALKNNYDPLVNADTAEVIKNLPAEQAHIATAAPSSPVNNSDLEHPSITPQSVQQFFATNAAEVANRATQTANDPNATPEEIAAAQVAANAAEQTANQAASQMEPAPETYSDVPLSGFEEPYNPGPFDIPDRFDTFLANVAGTGLFSLPSQYFNSLPGGGSPTYTIEAGQYGTHTVDLSETMGTGLAVLKTVLLLCFAFLSVRVVVLKR